MFRKLLIEFFRTPQYRDNDKRGKSTAAVLYDFADWLDTQRSRTTRAAVHSDAKEACAASTHEFLREKAGHRFCYQCGERLLSEPSLGG